MSEHTTQTDPPADRCPFCEDGGREARGRYDGRILIGGRGVWRCPENTEHKWQDANETPVKDPASKGYFIVPGSS